LSLTLGQLWILIEGTQPSGTFCPSALSWRPTDASLSLVLLLLSLSPWTRFPLQLRRYFVLDQFISADMPFVLLFWFKSCHFRKEIIKPFAKSYN